MTTIATDFSTLTGTYTLDAAHCRIGFVARHAMVTKVRGAFNEFDGQAVDRRRRPEPSPASASPPRSPASTPATPSATTTCAPTTSSTPSASRRSPSSPPPITHLGGNDFEVTGDLTIKDVTKSVTIPLEFQGAATDPFGNERIGFEGSTQIQRSDFGVTYNAALETGGVLVSDKITLEFEISAIKTA